MKNETTAVRQMDGESKLPIIDEAKRQRQLKALERIVSGPKWNISVNGRMPTSDERNARPWHKKFGLPYEE